MGNGAKDMMGIFDDYNGFNTLWEMEPDYILTTEFREEVSIPYGKWSRCRG